MTRAKQMDDKWLDGLSEDELRHLAEQIAKRLKRGRGRPKGSRSKNPITRASRLGAQYVRRLHAIAGDARLEAASALAELADNPALHAWMPSIRHAHSQQGRLMRDQNFRHPTASAVRAALDCGPPVNASDLKVVVVSARGAS
jgi:hypothetical protein